MVNVCVCIPISTPTISGISQFFSGKKVTAPPKSEGARTPMVLAARKTYLITARARKNKRTARMLASARKDHSIPLV